MKCFEYFLIFINKKDGKKNSAQIHHLIEQLR